MDTTAPAIEIHSLQKTFHPHGQPPVHAVDGIDLTVGSGEIVAALGPNGAGKTTLLDMVLGLTDPTAGRIQIFGTTPRQAITAGRVSAVLQTGGLLRDLTVRETVQIIASTFPGRESAVDDVIERAGLQTIDKRRISKCSGGEQQRVRFALALIPDPDLLVLDEPTAGMDVTARRDFWTVMHEEANAGRTVVFATHHLAEASDFADRIVVVANGRVIADDTTERIRATASDRTVSVVVDDDPSAAVADLTELDHVSSAAAADNRVVVHTSDSDDIARRLLSLPHAHDLLVTDADLEDAFVALTGGNRS